MSVIIQKPVEVEATIPTFPFLRCRVGKPQVVMLFTSVDHHHHLGGTKAVELTTGVIHTRVDAYDPKVWEKCSVTLTSGD